MITHNRGHDSPRHRAGFTKTDLALSLSLLALLGTLGLSAASRVEGDGARLWCLNNLRLLGRAVQAWGDDHQHRVPWRVPAAEGGTQLFPRPGNAWYELAWVSNELASPKILACPSDTRRPANDFSTSASGGLINPAYRNNAVSYVVGLDAGLAGNGTGGGPETRPGDVLSADRNLKVDSVAVSCSSGVNNAASINAFSPQATQAAWTNLIHGTVGNLLFLDGRAITTSSEEMRLRMMNGDDNGSVHLLLP